jgi:hypothetical protein
MNHRISSTHVYESALPAEAGTPNLVAFSLFLSAVEQACPGIGNIFGVHSVGIVAVFVIVLIVRAEVIGAAFDFVDGMGIGG